MASLASSRENPVSEPVTTIDRPSQRARRYSLSRSSAIRTPAARHLSTIARCQSTVNHSTTRRGDGRPDSLDVGQLLLGGRHDRLEAAELRGQRTGRGGADVADRQRDQHPPQRCGPWPVAGWPAAACRWPTASPPLVREQLGAQQVLGGEGEQVALVGDDVGLQQRRRRLVAESLDVEARRGRRRETPARATAPGTTGSSGSGCRRRPPWPARARSRTPGSGWASRIRVRSRRAGRPRGRAPRG